MEQTVATATAEHGRNAYARGCRCGLCRKEWNAYMRQRRRDEGAKPRRQTAARSLARVAFYPQKSCNVSSSLTTLGFGILNDACVRENRSYGDIFERLLRLYGQTVTFDSVN